MCYAKSNNRPDMNCVKFKKKEPILGMNLKNNNNVISYKVESKQTFSEGKWELSISPKDTPQFQKGLFCVFYIN